MRPHQSDENSGRDQSNPAPCASSRKRQIGLVLEGGGAKGAFAFGVLRALDEAHIPVAAVTGTSVGALNAVLWSTKNLHDGNDIWSNLTFENSLRFRYGRLGRWIAIFVISCVNIVGTGFGPRFISPGVLRLAQFLSFFALLYMGIGGLGDDGLLMRILLSLSGAVLAVTTTDAHSTGSIAKGFVLISALILVIRLIVLAVKWYGLLAGFAMLGILIAFIRLATSTTNDPAPLRATIQRILEKGLSCRTFVTTAIQQELWIPDMLHTTPLTVAGATLDPRDSSYEYVPVYHELNSLDSGQTRVDAVLASASLPFGITPSVTLDHKSHVDGGLADNCPIFPLVDLDILTTIIIVHLDTKEELQRDRMWPVILDLNVLPSICATSSDIIKVWQRFRRLLHIAKYCDANTLNISDRSTIPTRTFLPDRTLKNIPEVLNVYPPTSLGNLFNGTMAFNPETARGNIELGYRVGLEFLGRHNLTTECTSGNAVGPSQ